MSHATSQRVPRRDDADWEERLATAREIAASRAYVLNVPSTWGGDE